jgi:rRNA maturation endonuclease Nob1
MSSVPKDTPTIEYAQIAVRLKQNIKDKVEIAAKAEGVSIPEWVRIAIEMRLKTINSCQNCGTINDKDAIFCKKCGQPLTKEEIGPVN